jgi:hypothetical protein
MMKSIFGAAVMAGFVAGLALAPMSGHAETMKKTHKASRASQTVPAQPEYRGGVYDPSGGNAAAGGNNANSMDGSNSAGNNANGRTSGGGHG